MTSMNGGLQTLPVTRWTCFAPLVTSTPTFQRKNEDATTRFLGKFVSQYERWTSQQCDKVLLSACDSLKSFVKIFVVVACFCLLFKKPRTHARAHAHKKWICCSNQSDSATSRFVKSISSRCHRGARCSRRHTEDQRLQRFHSNPSNASRGSAVHRAQRVIQACAS